MNTLLAIVLKVTDERRDVILACGLYHRSPWRHLPPWFQPKIYATNTARCPVSFYKNFRSHRPTEMNAPKSPFYLAVRHNRRSNEEVWYMNAPLGKNEIGKFLSTAAKNAGLHREGKSFYQENPYFEAPWCWCSRELCSPTEWPQKHGEFTVLEVRQCLTPKEDVLDPQQSWSFWIQRWSFIKCP